MSGRVGRAISKSCLVENVGTARNHLNRFAVSFRSTVIPTSRVVADTLSSRCRPAPPMSNDLTDIRTISPCLGGDMGK